MSKNDETAGTIMLGMATVVTIAGLIWLYPQVSVYYSQMSGKGALMSAESTRQVRVLEAQAKLEASALDAQSEVRRALGSAQAIAAVKDQLGGPDGYLRWLYIQGLQEPDKQGGKETYIYVPTDGLVPLPISEAGRAVSGRPLGTPAP